MVVGNNWTDETFSLDPDRIDSPILVWRKHTVFFQFNALAFISNILRPLKASVCSCLLFKKKGYYPFSLATVPLYLNLSTPQIR